MSHTNSWRPEFFLFFFFKKSLFDVRSEVQLVRCNIVSTGQYVRALFFSMEIVTCQLNRERKFSDEFRGYRKVTPGCNGLIKFVELIYRAIFSWRKLNIDYLCFSFLHWLFLKIMYSRSNETGTLDVLKIKFSSLTNHGDRAC